MLTYLPSYTALIQLLVGSVIVSSFFKKDFDDPLKELRKKTATNYYYSLYLNFDYDLLNSSVAKRNLQALRKSLMLILSIYGCMVLFYCASFPNEYIIPPILTNNNGIIIPYRNDLITPFPSPLGIALLSIVVTIYQIHIIHNPSTPIHSNNAFFLVGILLMFAIFAIFIVCFPTIELDLSYFINSRKETWESWWITIVNYWVFLNLILWIGFHIKLHYAASQRHIKHLDNHIENLKFKRDVYITIKSLKGIKNRFDFIVKQIQQENNPTRKKYLLKKAKQELKIESNYFSPLLDKNSNPIALVFDTQLPLTLNNLIDSIPNLTKLRKKRLKCSIIKRPRIDNTKSSETQQIYQEVNRLNKSISNELCNLGIIKKKGK